MPHQTHVRDAFTISTDPVLLDLDLLHNYLSCEAYWAVGIPRATLVRAVAGSLCFALLDGGKQIGFARVISDRATIAFLADVFVLPEYRGRGLGKWLVECVLAHPQLQGLRRWILVTRDAHELYRRFGFKPLARPEGFMEVHDAQAYTRG